MTLATASVHAPRTHTDTPMCAACPAQVPIPAHMDIYHLRNEAEPQEKTALEAVIDHVKEEMAKLNQMEEEIMTEVRGTMCEAPHGGAWEGGNSGVGGGMGRACAVHAPRVHVHAQCHTPSHTHTHAHSLGRRMSGLRPSTSG